MLRSKFSIIQNGLRYYSSALYVTGDKAQTNFAVLTPVIDFDAQLSDKAGLIENIRLRQLPIDINKVEERWQIYKEINERKHILDLNRSEIGQTIANLMKSESNIKVKEEIEKLKLHLKIIKEDFKNLRNMSYSVEEGAALQVLGLPNVLHPKTPHSDELEIYSYLDKPNMKTESHVKIGQSKDYLKIINHMTCYLKSDAALFELAIQNYFLNELLGLNYVQFSNSDFVKSVVVEGCGTDPSNNSEVLMLEDIHCIKNDELNKLHLVGASSLYSFMAYFTKHFVQKTNLPMKMFCLGRKYCTVDQSSPKNLFNLNQSSEVGLFIATLENQSILEDILNDVTMLYKHLGYHFRVVLMPANKLTRAESLKLSIQMYSGYLSTYIEVGGISFYESYLSKRLLLNYSENKDRKYPNVISGNVLNIHKVLGCVLEYTCIGETPLLNNFLLKYVG